MTAYSASIQLITRYILELGADSIEMGEEDNSTKLADQIFKQTGGICKFIMHNERTVNIHNAGIVGFNDDAECLEFFTNNKTALLEIMDTLTDYCDSGMSMAYLQSLLPLRRFSDEQVFDGLKSIVSPLDKSKPISAVAHIIMVRMVQDIIFRVHCDYYLYTKATAA